LGYTGCQRLTGDKDTWIAKPKQVSGTKRYLKVKAKLMEMQRLMHGKAGFEIISDVLKFLRRLEEWGNQINNDNTFELFSLLYMVHNEEGNLSCHNNLKYHCDKGTCPFWDFLACCWKHLF
jgi:hypothetical protein